MFNKSSLELDYGNNGLRLTSLMNCGCGNQPFRFCCSVLPDMNESTSTRLIYDQNTYSFANCSSGINRKHLNGTCVTIDMEADCHHVVSYMAIYRLSMALVTFFFLFAIISYGIENSRNCRAGIHNGILIGKIYSSLCLMCRSFNYPMQHMQIHFLATFHLCLLWRHIISVGTIIYLVVQLKILINFSHSWTENWLTKAQNAMVMSGMLFFSIFTCGVILMYAEAIHQKNCTLNQIVVGVNLSLCLLSAFISVSPNAEKYTGDARGRLLQSSIISCYILYLSWSAFLNKSSNFTLTNVAIQKDNLYNYCSVGYNDIFTYVGIAMVFLILIYSSTRLTRRKEILSATGQHTFSQCQTCCPVLPNLQSEENDGGQRI
uniref:Uncharacterized protein n=1 Tax=Strigamia maritima TaxID=126957 RepID=T1IS37_STRMM